MNPSRPFIRRPVASVLTAVAVVLVGALAYGLLPVAPLPQVDFPTIYVSASLPGASPNTVHTVTAFDVSLVVFFGLAGTVLWLWMAHANGRGRSWARVLSSVLFAVLTVTLPFTFIQISYVLPRITTLAQWGLAVAALVLLWARPSSAYFAAMRRPAGSPPGPAWPGRQR